MKKSTIATLLIFFILIPATLFLGTKLPGRAYYITCTLIIIEVLLPFFIIFEGRKPQAREMVVIAVMCAISIVSRVAIPIPHFKPTFAIIMLSGIALGPEAGFMIGAVTAFGSNFFAGQGAFTPWQMMAYGAGGLLAGFLAQRGWLSRKPIWLAVFSFLTSVFWVGLLLDVCSVFLMPIGHTWEAAVAVFIAGFPANLMQGICSVVVMLLFGKPLLERLDRIIIKYNMLSCEK